MEFTRELEHISEGEPYHSPQATNTPSNSNHKYINILDEMEDSVIILDEENRIRDMSKAAKTYFGGDLAISQKLEWLNEELTEFCAGHHSRWSFEKELEVDGKGTRYFCVELMKQFDVGGVFVGTMVILRDITRIQKLRNEFLDSIREPLVLLDLKGTHVYANPAFYKMVDFEEKELQGMKMPLPYLPGKSLKMLEQVMRSKRKADIIVKLQKRGGEFLVCSISITLLEGLTGRPTYWLLSITDITAERKLNGRKLKKQFVRYNLEEGKVYLVEERMPLISAKAFEELLKVGYKGLIISRTPYSELKKLIKGEFEFLWISEVKGGNTIPFELKDIESILEGLLGGCVVFFEKMCYLLFKNGPRKIVSFVDHLNDIAYLNNFIVIMSLDPSHVSPRTLEVLRRQTSNIEPREGDSLPDDLLECLRYVHRCNSRGVRPTYSDIGQALKCTKPTIRKRIEKLRSMGYVEVHACGRCKLVELGKRDLPFFDFS